MNGGTPITAGTPFTVVGTKVAGFGGYLLDTDGNPTGNLIAKAYNGNTQVGANAPAAADGFDFAPVPPGTYRVKIYDALHNLKATSQQQSVAQDQLIAVNFTNPNPADPVMLGLATNGGGAGVADVTVELYNVAQHLVATRTTSASGS